MGETKKKGKKEETEKISKAVATLKEKKMEGKKLIKCIKKQNIRKKKERNFL